MTGSSQRTRVWVTIYYLLTTYFGNQPLLLSLPMLPSSSSPAPAPAHPTVQGKRPRRERGGKNQRRSTYRPALPGGDWGSSPAQPAAPYACPSQPNHPPRGWTPPTPAAPMPLLRAHPAPCPCVHSAPPPPLSNHRHWVKPGLEFHGNPHGAPRPALPGAMRPPPGALRPTPPGAARPAQHAGPRPPCAPTLPRRQPPGALRPLRQPPGAPRSSCPAPCALAAATAAVG